MPATPAWPPKSYPRLFVPTPLAKGAVVQLDASQANYLGNVMRLGEGEHVLLFDGASGDSGQRLLTCFRIVSNAGSRRAR